MMINITCGIVVLFCILPFIASQTDCYCNKLNTCVNYKCKHKEFFPPTIQEIIGLFAIFIGSAVSNAGGIGGGGLLIPILILILMFEVHEAIPLSKIMIFAGALTSFIMGLKNSHPFRKAITIDYNIAGIMIPMILFGTMVGVSLNKVFPAPIILFSLTIILVINTYKTISKGIKEYHKENEITRSSITKLISMDYQDEEDDEFATLKSKQPNKIDESSKTKASICPTLMNTYDGRLEVEFQMDLVKFPIVKLSQIFISFVLLIVITLLKGSDNLPSFIGLESCSFEYWIIYASFFPASVYLTYRYSLIVMNEYNRRIAINYPYDESDIKWSKQIMIYYPLVGLFGGMMAGVLGIGGGLIFGPLLLELGIHPIVSTATSNFLVLFTSSSTSLQFVLHGMLNIKYGFILVVASSIGSYFGTVIIQRLVKESGRGSLLIFTLGIVLGISTLLIPSYTFYKIINSAESIWSFENPC